LAYHGSDFRIPFAQEKETIGIQQRRIVRNFTLVVWLGRKTWWRKKVREDAKEKMVENLAFSNSAKDPITPFNV
jgi:hypothetical protein